MKIFLLILFTNIQISFNKNKYFYKLINKL